MHMEKDLEVTITTTALLMQKNGTGARYTCFCPRVYIPMYALLVLFLLANDNDMLSPVITSLFRPEQHLHPTPITSLPFLHSTPPTPHGAWVRTVYHVAPLLQTHTRTHAHTLCFPL